MVKEQEKYDLYVSLTYARLTVYLVHIAKYDTDSKQKHFLKITKIRLSRYP